MQDPPRPNPPLDYRPHSEDAKARRWPLWVGLAIAAVVIAFGLLSLTRRVAISPRPMPYAPATQPAWPPGPSAPPASMTQPTTGETPGR